MKIEVAEDILDGVQMLVNNLIFSGGKGVDLNVYIGLFEEDFDTILEYSRLVFESLGIELRISENMAIILPNRRIFLEFESNNLLNKFNTLPEDEREILTRFIVLFLVDGKYEPIPKEKLRFELTQTYGINYSDTNLKNLVEFGYLKIVQKNFVDLGWRLKNSPEILNFEEKFLELIKDIEKKS